MVLLMSGDLAEARPELEAALDISRRASDRTLVLRCLAYLALLGLRQHEVDLVKERAPETMDLARSLGFPEYEGLANAALAWVAWQEGRPRDVEVLAGQARELWQKCVVHYVLYWAALWPLIAVRLADGRFEDAIAAARELLGPDQQRLPLDLDSAVRTAVEAFGEGDVAPAAERLGEALDLAVQLRFA
jgi:hypothetical protein